MTKDSEESTTPSLRRMVDRAIEEKLSSMMIGPQPGIVLSYNAAKGTVKVQPLVLRVLYGEEGVRTKKQRPVLEDVPVLFIGSGVNRTTTPVTNGDLCLLIPCGVPMTRWLLQGGYVDPGDELVGRADVVALPCSARSPATAPPTTATVINGSIVRVGGPTGTEKTVKQLSFQGAHSTLINAIVTALNGISGGAGTAVSTALTTFNNNASWKSTNAEVK